MKDLVADNGAQNQQDADLLRSLAAVHFAYGGMQTAHDLLALARTIKPDDGPVLVLSARVADSLGDFVSAARLMTAATRLEQKLTSADLAFARALCSRNRS